MKVEISFDENKFKFTLNNLIEAMTYDQKMDVIREFSMQRDIRDEVIKQLTGENLDFYWGDDNERRLKILSALEDELISCYKWSFIYEIKSYIKNHSDHTEIYWEMYHDKCHGEFFRKWMESKGIGKNYDKRYCRVERFLKVLKDIFKRLENGKKVRVEVEDDS